MKKFVSLLYILAALIPSVLFVPTNEAQAGSCVIISAQFNPSGQRQNHWFLENKTRADVVVKSTGCQGRIIKFSIEEADTCVLANCDDRLPDSGLDERQLLVPSDNFTVNLLLGEEACEGGPGYDCDLYVFMRDSDDNEIYDSFNKSNGQLLYECDVLCNTNAKFLGIISNGSDDKPADVEAQNLAVAEIASKDVYIPLAPIGGVTEVKTSNIHDYLNTIFQLGIGLCGALAVVMIIISSIQYMGNESVFGKTEAKGKILSALGGLFIALAAYALLNTINPDLTGKNGVSVDQVALQVDPEVETVPAKPTYEGGGDSKLCTGGYGDVATYGSPSKINVCKTIGGVSIADNLKKMIDAAKQGGIVLTGSGTRSYTRQVELRKEHHCADVYNAPSSTCNPPTARPGHSNHEIGGAIDFSCNGGDISDHSNACYVWLSKNAATYGFKNLPSEPWHWSFNGK
jgi:hypothetical protein